MKQQKKKMSKNKDNCTNGKIKLPVLENKKDT